MKSGRLGWGWDKRKAGRALVGKPLGKILLEDPGGERIA
jgi:hypothetical protein